MRKLKNRIFSLLLSVVTVVSMLSGTAIGASAAYDKDVSNLTAAEICLEMGAGWNLGNSLDATNAYTLDSETSWGNPKTTKAMIDAVKKQGFTCVRVPVTWFNHMDSNYQVNSEWMARVKEVVNYCVDDGLYVILNSHHESWNRPTTDNYEAASNELKILWKQIATEFAGYDRHLIFEGMNEPRNYDGANEWDGGTAEMRAVINKLNADFVETVRSTGGINSTRCLMIPTYAASIEYAAMADLEIPDDDNIIVSVHGYAPYNFAFNVGSGATSTFSSDQQIALDAIFKNISNLFISKGIPVCMGEYSATNKDNLDERVKWAAYYAKKCKELGMSCMLWDNNAYTSGSSEAHGHLNRFDNGNSWYDQPVVDAIVKSYNETEVDIPEPLTVPDLSKANCTVLSEQTMTAEGYSPTAAVQYDFTKMKENSVIAVYFSGSANPKFVLQDNRSYSVWCEVSAYVIENGVAYYSYDDLNEAYTAQYQSAYGETPSVPFYQAFQCFVTGAGSQVTVTKIVYAELSDSNVTETKSIDQCSVSLSGDSFSYTGSAIEPAVTVMDGSTVLTKGTDYTVSYSNNVNAGTATVTVNGIGNYTGSVSKNFTIVKTEEKITDLSQCDITLSYTTYEYTGLAAKPKVTVKAGNDVLVSGTDYAVRYANNVEIGTAQVIIAGKGSYTGRVTKTFEIIESSNKDIADCTITLSKTVYKSSGSACKPKVTVTNGSTTLTAGTDYVVRYVDNVEPGTASVIIAGRGNYTGRVTKTFTILDSNAKQISDCTITLSKTQFTYTGNSCKPKVTVKDGDTVLTIGTDYNVRYVNNVNVGTATVVISGTGKYQGIVNKTFTIM